MGQEDTPWRRVYEAFGARVSLPYNQSDFARELGCHRSKVSRVLADDEGLINGRDQRMIVTAAKSIGLELDPAILVAGAK